MTNIATVQVVNDGSRLELCSHIITYCIALCTAVDVKPHTFDQLDHEALEAQEARPSLLVLGCHHVQHLVLAVCLESDPVAIACIRQLGCNNTFMAFEFVSTPQSQTP